MHPQSLCLAVATVLCYLAPIAERKDDHTPNHTWMMWDVCPYALNMFHYHWLIKKLILPMAKQNRARQEIQEEIQGEQRQSQGDVIQLSKERHARAPPVSHRPCGNTQMNRNGLI